MRWCRFAAAAACIVLPAFGAAQSNARVLRGTVSDSAGAAIGYANIVIETWQRIVADSLGRFRIETDARRRLRLTVRRVGYADVTVTVPPGRDSTLRFQLNAAGDFIVGDPRVGSLETNGFYTRLADVAAGRGAGHFVTPEEIEQWRPSRTSQVLLGIAGLRIARAAPHDLRAGAWGASGCPMTVYLDRTRINSAGQRMAVVLVDEVIPASALAAVEVYAYGLKPPPEFPPLNGTCGVLVAWTY